MENKLFITGIVAVLTLGSIGVAIAAPNWVYQRTILPTVDNAFDLGTTTGTANSGVWRNIYTNNITISGTCTGCGSGSAQSVSTSTNETSGQLAYWTTTSGTPAKLGEVATTTLTASSPLSLSQAVVKVGGSNSVLTLDTSGTWSGLAGSASVLSPGRTINGVAFTGASNITITAASSTLLADTNTFSTAATTTFSGNARVVGNLQVDGGFFAPVTLVSSGNATINGSLTVTGAVDLDTFTSAILLTGAGGDVAEYAGATCTNQFVRSLSALGAATCATVVAGDVDLADLTATDSTLTFSGTYDGSTARTIGLNLGQANTWTALQQFGNASSTQMTITATGRLYIPAGANPTIAATGDIAINTTAASSSIRYFDGTAERSLFPDGQGGIPFASSTLAYIGAYGTSGTTTMKYLRFYRPASLLGLYCDTDTGTAHISIGNGSATTTMQCSTVSAFTSSSVTFTMGQWLFIRIGTKANDPNIITLSPVFRKDAD